MSVKINNPDNSDLLGGEECSESEWRDDESVRGHEVQMKIWGEGMGEEVTRRLHEGRKTGRKTLA